MKIYILFVGIFAALCNGQQRIAGGNPTTVAQFPFVSALLRRTDAGVFSHACGGSIITQNAILTAASCFYDGDELDPVGWWRARVGSSERNGAGVIHIVSQIVVNPDFSLATKDSNIAVIRTRFNINLVPGLVERAFLPGAAYTLATNNAVQAIGWGTNVAGVWAEQLQVTNIFMVDQALCTSRYAAANITITANMMCASWLDVGVRGQCEGDEGSPLLRDGVVVGVFSHNNGCASYWFPGVNTRVPLFARWIVSTAIA